MKQEPTIAILIIVAAIMRMREFPFSLNKIGNDVFHARGMNTSSM